MPKRSPILALNTQSQVRCRMISSDYYNPFDYYALGFVISHSSCKWVAKFELELKDDVYLMMFAKGASSDSPVSVEHPIQLKINGPHQNLPPPIICLNHLASSGPHFLKRVKGLTLQKMVLHGDSYELFSSPHLQLHSLELVKALHSGKLLISLLCEQNMLRNLRISWNWRIVPFAAQIGPFTVEEYKALCKWLSSPQCSLRTLNIGGNDLSLEATEDIIYSLKDNCTLESLDLSSSSIHLKALSTLLQLPLVTLSLSDCNLESRETCIIATALCSNSTLVDINLSFNLIGNEGVIALAEMLKENKTLKKLDLSYCGIISQTAVQTLQDSIQSNGREIELNLEYT